MHKRMMKCGGALFFAGVLALTGCQGDDGPQGDPGQPGQPGLPGEPGEDLVASAKAESCSVCHPDAGGHHQAVYDAFTDETLLKVDVVDLQVAANPTPATNFTATLTVDITGADGQPLTNPALLKQKTFYANEYDASAKEFSTANQFSFCAALSVPPATACTTKIEPVAGVAGRYTLQKVNAPFNPLASTDAYLIGYVATGEPIVPAKGHYTLYPDVYNFGQKIVGTAEYVSAANVEGCEKCHGAPYQKHGYRGGRAVGLNDMTACKACHTDQRGGTHADWQALVDMPREFAEANGVLTDAQKAKYAYVASTMNDTHMSHAMEFAYPQSMANCVACHEGRLDVITADSKFTLETCKSCHPVTGGAVADRDAKRAPPLKDILPAGVNAHTQDLYAPTMGCTACHTTGSGMALKDIHPGFDKTIYASEGVKHSSIVKAQVGAVTFDSATKRLTVPFTVIGGNAQAIVKPTVVISLYGYDTKDFIVGGHSSQPAPDGKRNLEWTEGASGNSPRLTVTPAAAAGNASWTATADLSLWAGLLADGTVKRAEIGILPVVGLDQTQAVSATNPEIAVAGVSKMFDLVGKAIVADAAAYGRAIVSTAKCNNCHDALATTFHHPAYGTADVVGCRLCHVTTSGGSYLEMQSRSIDSYVHAIHRMQPFDIKSVDFADKLEALRYGHHVESTYPNFTILNCESCHNPGTYEVPDQAKSMPGLLSAAAVLTNRDRAIGTVPSVVTGAGSRACGSCHRAEMINEDAAGDLAAFNAHTESFGTNLVNNPGVLDAAIAKIMAFFK